MRTPFDELTEQELIALPPEEIDSYVDLACAEAGVKLLPPQPTAPTKTRPLPDQTLFKLNHEDLRFTDRGAALRVVDAINAAAKAGHVFTEAYVHLAGSHYEKKASPFVDRLDVSELQLFSEKAAQQHGAALEECARANETYQTNKLEYDQAVAERLSLNKRIRDKIEAAKGAESKRARMRAEFQRYLALAEGRRAVAANFLKSAHPTAPELLPDLFNIDEVAEAVGRPRAYQSEDVEPKPAVFGYQAASLPGRADWPPIEWRDVSTAPRGEEVWFLIVPKTAEETYYDTSNQPILATGGPFVKLTRYGRWGALLKATHWCPVVRPEIPPPPPLGEAPRRTGAV